MISMVASNDSLRCVPTICTRTDACTVLELRTTTLQKCEAVPRRARFQGSYCVSLNSRLEINKEKEKERKPVRERAREKFREREREREKERERSHDLRENGSWSRRGRGRDSESERKREI